MSVSSTLRLSDPVNNIGRTTEAQKKALKRLRIETIHDLLYHFPTRYTHVSSVTTIEQAQHDDLVTVYGVLSKIEIKKGFHNKQTRVEAILTDLNNNNLKILWFHQAFIAKTLKEGSTVKLTGKIQENKYGKSLINPEFEKLKTLPIDTGDSLFNKDGSQEYFGFPVYQESRGVSSKWIYHTILKSFQQGILDKVSDPLPEYLCEQYNLPNLKTALIWMHSPQKSEHAEAAKKRFAFEEMFLIQISRQQARAKHLSKLSYTLKSSPKLLQKFIERFPFTPTESQAKVVREIITDMSTEHPMSRLLEGDVGSGKTFVAATAAWVTTQERPKNNKGKEQGFGHLQVAYMAPTEVLATQLFENFIKYFTGTGIQIGLITGSSCRKFPSKVNQNKWTDISRRQLLKWVENGEIPILIGTHTLIQKSVKFKDLALVIIDEQHRFGTQQRMKLGSKDGRIPHLLSMTATPIPRTLALTIYGDLDLSIIDTLPTGRKPVITEVVPPNPEARSQTYEKIRQELYAGRQAYVICPRIDEPDPKKKQQLQLKSVIAEAERLSKHEFKEFRIGIMHSKMKKQEKQKIMEAFYLHDIDILVSTSVVEVGVNVPNATSMIIEGAERFGLAQLHQLRGRVTRSSHQAYCYLFADIKSEKTTQRLQALLEAKNGFELAEHDLMLRGSGDLLGIKQWGMSDLAMEALKNITMVEFARKGAQHIIEHDPSLESYPELAQAITRFTRGIHLE